jgi:transposase
LTYAIDGEDGVFSCDNTIEGRARMIAFLQKEKVKRVGMESTGVYHLDAAEELRATDFKVLVMQPNQVKAYATFKLLRAKSDPIDARMIAECTAAYNDDREAPDARLAPLAEHLTMIEQIEEDLTRAKVRRERFRIPRLLAKIDEEIKAKSKLKREELRGLAASIRSHRDLARRLALLQSIEGVGERTAIALVVRMPELGRISREEAASLIGVAPFVHESGKYKGQRRIGGGRARARTSLYAAAQAAAKRWNPALIALYDRLRSAGKPHAVAIIACVRKMITFANTVLAQNRPWEKREYKMATP